MTGNPNDGVVSDGGQGSTPSQPSSPETPAPFDGDVTKLIGSLLDQRFAAFEKSLGDKVGRAQGAADRSQNAVRELAARIEQYEKKGMSREEAITAIEQTDADSQWRQSLEKKLDSLAERLAGGGTQANAQQQVAKVFESIGLDVKDPRVASALLTKYESAEQVELAAYRLQRQIQQSPNPNPAQSPSLPGNSGYTGLSQGQAETKLVELQGLYKNYTQNRPAIEALENELKAAGVLSK